MDINAIVQLLISAITGGGLVALFTIPELKAGKKLDNAEKLIAKYDAIIERLEDDNHTKDERINELTSEVRKLQEEVGILSTKLKTLQLIHEEDTLLKCTKINCGIRSHRISKEDKKKLLAQQSNDNDKA